MSPPLLPAPRCECCGRTTFSVRMYSSQTNYQREELPHERAKRLARSAIFMLVNEGNEVRNPFEAPGEFWCDVQNRDLSLCAECGSEHQAQMEERWREYHAGLF